VTLEALECNKQAETHGGEGLQCGNVSQFLAGLTLQAARLAENSFLKSKLEKLWATE
jgi:hypothetical protein